MADSVNTDINVNVQDINGKISYIDPNAINDSSKEYNDLSGQKKRIHQLWDGTDYCIAVDLQIEIKSRFQEATNPTSDSDGNNGTSNRIYLISWKADNGRKASILSGRRFYYGHNQPETDEYAEKHKSDKHINYLTNEGTEHTYYDVYEDNISNEMLGIESIDITYDNYYCPQVKLNLVDVRGTSLFSPQERTHSKVVDGIPGFDKSNLSGSLFRSLFSLPNPSITMFVKGYYGTPITYDLAFQNVNVDFNNNTGNFNVDLELIGYRYSLLNDIPVNLMVCAPYCSFAGADYWKNTICTNSDYSLDGATPVGLMQVFKVISEVDSDTELQQANNEVANTQNTQNAIESDIPSLATVFDGFKNNLHHDSSSYFLSDDVGRGVCIILYQGDLDNIEQDVLTQQYYKDTSKNFESMKQGLVNMGNSDANQFSIVYGTGNSVLYDPTTSGVSISIEAFKTANVNKVLKEIVLQNISTNTVFNQTWNYDVFVLMNNKTGEMFYDYLNKIKQNSESKKQAAIDNAKAVRNSKIVSGLGFRPTVKNMMKLLMEHFETLLYCMYSCAENVYKKNRTPSDCGFMMVEDSDFDITKAVVPPFPKVNDIQHGKQVDGWVGNKGNATMFPERDLVLGLIDATKYANAQMNNIVPDNTGANNTNSTNAQVPTIYMPLVMSDLFTTDKYLGELTDADLDNFFGTDPSILSFKLYLRASLIFNYYNTMGMNITRINSKYADVKDYAYHCGIMDAKNFYYAYKDIISDSFKDKIGAVSDFGTLGEGMLNIMQGKGLQNITDGDKIKKYKQGDLSKLVAKDNNLFNRKGYNIAIKPSNNIDTINSLVTDSNVSSETNGEVPSNGWRWVFIPDVLSNGWYIHKSHLQEVQTWIKEHPDAYTLDTFKEYVIIDENCNIINSSAFQNLISSSSFGFLHDRFVNMKRWTIQQECKERRYDILDDNGNPKSIKSDANVFNDIDYYGNKGSYQRAALFLDNTKMGGSGSMIQYYGSSVVINITDIMLSCFNKKQSYISYPKIELLYLGSLCWAYLFNDGLLYTVNSTNSKCMVKYTPTIIPIDNFVLAKYFMNWADDGNGFGYFRNNLEFNMDAALKQNGDLQTNIENEIKKSGKSGWNLSAFDNVLGFDYTFSDEFLKSEAVTSLTKDVELLINESLVVLNNGYKNNMVEYCSYFMQQLKDEILNASVLNNALSAATNEVVDTAVSLVNEEDPNQQIDTKISIYNSLKRLWDKWLVGSSLSDYNIPNWFDKNFHFIDSFFTDIGDLILVDMSSMLEIYNDQLKQGQAFTLLQFITDVLGKTNMTFNVIQNWANLSDPETMKKAFVPVPYNSMVLPSNYATQSDFVTVYNYEPSHLLGDDSDESEYKGDSFMANNYDSLPQVIKDYDYQDLKIPAFSVSYGQQYQSYFHNIKVNTNKGQNTEWSIGAQMQIAQMGSDKVNKAVIFQGQDLYTIFSNVSYECTVSMMGCCWIQPLMYFCLTNIPMFRGTYMISKMSHSIRNGEMTTTFTGCRLPKIANRIVDNAFLNTQGNFDEEDSITRENAIASVENDCAYKFYNPLMQTQINASYEHTVNIVALKTYRPDYITKLGYDSVWDAIVSTINREFSNGVDNLSQKLVALCMFNQHALASKKKNGGWRNIFSSSFKGSKGSFNSGTEANVKSIFENPLSILGGKDELPLDIDLSGQYANRYGNIQAYSYNKPIGKIKDQKNSITKSSVYRIGQYSLNNSQFPEYTSSDSSINHHSSKYYFTYGRNQFVQIYEGCRTDDSEPIWTDSDLAEMKKDPNVPTDDKKSNGNNETLINGFVNAVSRTSQSVAAMACDVKVCSEGTDNWIIISACDSVSKKLLPQNNATLFDMIVRTGAGESQGYYGWFKHAIWLTSAKSQEYPDYILVQVIEKTDGTKNMRSITVQFSIASNIKSLKSTFTKSDLDKWQNHTYNNNKLIYSNGTGLDSVPKNWWKIMGKNIADKTTFKDTDTILNAYTYAFIDDSVTKKYWEKIKTYLLEDKALPCPANGDEVNDEYAFSNKDTDSIFKTSQSKIKMKTISSPISDFWGPFGNTSKTEIAQHKGSPWNPARTSPAPPEFHSGIDFSEKGVKGDRLVAGHDGIVLSCHQAAGFCNVIIVAYNLENKDGSILLGVYTHMDAESIYCTAGQIVKAGDILAKAGSCGKSTGIHCHFELWLMPKDSSGKYTFPGYNSFIAKTKENNHTNQYICNPEEYINFKTK